MNSENQVLFDLIEEMHEKFTPVCAFHRRVTRKLSTAVLLAHLLRHFKRWEPSKIYFTDAQILKDTPLTVDELRGAKQEMKESSYMTLTREGGKGRTHYELDVDRFMDLVRKTSPNPDSGNCPNKKSCFGKSHKHNSGNCPNSLRERHKEIPKRGSGRAAAGLLPEQPTPSTQPAEKRSIQPVPTSAKFQRTFFKMWKSKYGRDYVWGGAKDGSAIKTLHARLKGDRDEFKRVVGRFLADDRDFVRGHPVTELLRALTRYSVPTEEEAESGEAAYGDVRVTSRTLTAEEAANYHVEL
jgi:hypothetical protein